MVEHSGGLLFGGNAYSARLHGLANVVVTKGHARVCLAYDDPQQASVKRLRTRVVVVVVKELLYLVTSVICVRITTTSYHIRSDFRLKRRSYRDGSVVLNTIEATRKQCGW